jgi:two-component system, OmpR family, sensor kinase
MSLRARLTLLFAVATLVVLTGAGLGFLWQLRTSVTAALDGSLRARAHTLTAQLAAGRQPLTGAGGDQQGQHQGNYTGSDELTQIIAPAGKLLFFSPAAGSQPLLSAAQLRTAVAHPLSFSAVIEGEPQRILAIAARDGSRQVVAVVGASTGIVDAAMARARLVILAAGPLAVAGAGIGAWMLTGAALRPVGRMRRRLAEITDKDTSARLLVPVTRDEIASLAVTTNDLLYRLQRALTRQRDFVADASHELLTPLTALRAELELASRPGRSRQALESAVTAAVSDTDRLIRMAEDLLLLAGAEERSAFLRLQPVEISSVLSAAVDGLTGPAQDRGVMIEVAAVGNLPAQADPDKLRQAADNLITNAIRHTPPGSAVEVSGHAGTAAGRRTVTIQVRDHGPGFPPDFLPHAFERFRRADPARNSGSGGSGLGLAIVASIAQAHGGQATAANHPGGGACVRLELPSDGPPWHQSDGAGARM